MGWGGFSGKLLPIWAFCSLPRLGQQEEKQESQLSALLLLLFYFYFSIQGYTQSFLKLFYGVCVCSVWCACMLTCIDLRKYMSQHMCTKAQMHGQRTTSSSSLFEKVLMFAVMWDRLAIPQASLCSLVSPQGPWYYRCTQRHLEWDGCQESEFRSSQLSGKGSTHRGSSPALPVSTHWPCSPRSQYSSLFLFFPPPINHFCSSVDISFHVFGKPRTHT